MPGSKTTQLWAQVSLTIVTVGTFMSTEGMKPEQEHFHLGIKMQTGVRIKFCGCEMESQN